MVRGGTRKAEDLRSTAGTRKTGFFAPKPGGSSTSPVGNTALSFFHPKKAFNSRQPIRESYVM